MKVKVDGKDMSADELTAYIERLEAVAEAARVLQSLNDSQSSSVTIVSKQKFYALHDAIAKLDERESGGG